MNIPHLLLVRPRMFRARLVCVILAAMCMAPPAIAATKASQADVVAKVKVLATTRVKPPKGSPTLARFYVSWALVGSRSKGDVQPGSTLLVRWSDDGKAAPFLPGAELTAYLTWDEDSRVYLNTWTPNKDEQARLEHARTFLPKGRGEVVTSIPKPEGKTTEKGRALIKR